MSLPAWPNKVSILVSEGGTVKVYELLITVGDSPHLLLLPSFSINSQSSNLERLRFWASGLPPGAQKFSLLILEIVHNLVALLHFLCGTIYTSRDPACTVPERERSASS